MSDIILDITKLPPEAIKAWVDYDPPPAVLAARHEHTKIRDAFMAGFLAHHAQDEEAMQIVRDAAAFVRKLRVTESAIETGTRALLDRQGFGYYTDPMEGGQDAYDVTNDARDEVRVILEALERA